MDEWTLNDLLECSVCLDRLDTSSKVLPCQHTFCKKCLDEIVSSHKELRCPECRVLVETKVEELPPNVLLMRILEGMKNNPRKRTGQSSGNTAGSPPPATPSSTGGGEQSSGNLTPQHQHARQKPGNLATNHQRQRSSELQLNQSAQQPVPVSKTTGPGGQPYARAIFDYVSKEQGDLNFKKGDIIVLKRKVDNNWFYGELNGSTGTFPLSYVQIITSLPSTHVPQCKAMYDFRMNNTDEEGCLKFSKGEVITIIRRVDENWAEGRLADKIGIFPISFVEFNNVAKALMKLSNSSQPAATARTAPPPTPSPLISTSSPPVPPQSIVIPVLPPPTPLVRQSTVVATSTTGGGDHVTSPSSSTSSSSSPTASSHTTSTTSSSSTESSPSSPHPTPAHPTASHPTPTHPTASHPTPTHPTASHPTPTHPTASHPTPTHPTASHPTPTHPTASHPTPSKRYSFPHLMQNQSQNQTQHRYSAEILSSPSSITVKESPSSSSTKQPTSYTASEPSSTTGNSSTSGVTTSSSGVRSVTTNSSGLSSSIPTSSSSGLSSSIPTSSSSGVSSSIPTSSSSGDLKRQPSLRSYKKQQQSSSSGGPLPSSGGSSTTSALVAALAASPHISLKTPALYIAIYPYKPQKEDELELRRGSVYTVLERCQDGWFKGTSHRTQRSGVFPGNYVAPAKSLPALQAQLRGLNRSNSGSPSSPSARPHSSSPLSASSEPPRLSTPKNRPSKIGGVLAASTPPDLPPRANSPSPSSWGASNSDTARASLLVIPPPNVSVPTTPVRGVEKKKDKGSSSGGVSLMRRLTNITARQSKSPPPPCYSMDNPVFEDSTTHVVPSTIVSSTSTSSSSTPHVHVRSDSCPSKLLGHVSEHTRLLSPASSQRQSKHKDRPSVMNHLIARPVEAVESPTGSSHHNHRKSNSLDATSTTTTCNSPSAATDHNRKPIKQIVPPARERYRCIAPYPPNSEYELELRVGDIIYVHKKRDDGWYKGTLHRTGRTGLFPASFVESF